MILDRTIFSRFMTWFSVKENLGEDYDEYLAEMTRVNLERIRIFGIVALIIMAAMIFLDISYWRAGKRAVSVGYSILYYAHLCAFGILSFSTLFAWLKSPEPTAPTSRYLRPLIGLILFLFMFNMVVVSVGDVFINGSVAAYIGMVFSFASIFILTDRTGLFLFISNLIFMLLLTNLAAGVMGADLTIQNINVITFSVIATLLSRMMFFNHARNFQHRKLITRQKRQLQELSRRDPLTNTLNRRSFAEITSAEIERMKRYNGEMSLVIFDLDHFKEINDRHGHSVGDSVLVKVTGLVDSLIRKTDYLFRWGGEEFIVLSPEIELSSMAVLAEKLRQSIDAHRFEDGDRVTASFGVTEYLPGESIDLTVQRADAALYNAKRKGRNRVEVISAAPRHNLSDISA